MLDSGTIASSNTREKLTVNGTASDISSLTSVESYTDQIQRSVDDTHLQRSRSTHREIDRASFSHLQSEGLSLSILSSLACTVTDQQRMKSASGLVRESSSISARRSVSEGEPIDRRSDWRKFKRFFLKKKRFHSSTFPKSPQ